MACTNPNCQKNLHTGVCRATRPEPFPIQPTRLLAAPEANVRPQPMQQPVYQQPMQQPVYQRPAVQPVQMDPRVPIMQQRIDALQSQLQQAQDALSGMTQKAATPCPACPPQQPCPPQRECPACAAPPPCPECGSQVLVSDQSNPNDFVPSTQSDFNGMADIFKVAGATADAQGQPSETPTYSEVALVQSQQPQSDYSYATALLAASASQPVDGMAGPSAGQVAEAPIVPLQRISPTMVAKYRHTGDPLPTPTSQIQGVCKNCKAPVAVGCGVGGVNVGAYSCPGCGFAHAGAIPFVPSPLCGDSRVRTVVRQYRQGLKSLPATKALLSQKFRLSAADVAYCLSR